MDIEPTGLLGPDSSNELHRSTEDCERPWGGRLSDPGESADLAATDRMTTGDLGETTRREEEDEDFECECHIYVETHDGRTSYRLVIERSRDEPD